MSQHFDLHTHTSLKTMLGGTDNNNRKDCWTIVKSQFLDALSGGILGSQGSLSQLQQGNVKIAVTALYSLEQAFAKNWLLKSVITKIEKDLSKKYLQAIANGKLSPYKNLLEELEHIKNAAQIQPDVKVVHSNFDIDQDKINLVIATEGMHCFQNTYDTSNKDAVINDIKNNFKEFIKQNRILYTGLTHLTRAPVCTHTYAMKMLKDKEFIPQGEGLTQAAKEIIDICYSTRGLNDKRTLIDIKHMGIVSRIQFYQYRAQQGYTNIPIVASHIAVTGRSLNNIKIQKPKPSARYADTFEVVHRRSFSDISFTIDPSPPEDIDFNPWSLNLYDEEIIYIIESGGIMGLILDARVLGVPYTVSTDAGEGIEYFSKESCNYLKANNHFNEKLIDENPEDEIIIDISKMESIGVAHLFANLMHIVKTYYKKYEATADKFKAWDHICIGSDSDGLIATINGYLDASYFDNLKAELMDIFDRAREGKLKKYFGNLSNDILLSKVFNSNGTKFLERNL